MSTFHDASRIEQKAMQVLEPFLRDYALDGTMFFIDSGSLRLFLQKEVGDVLLRNQQGQLCGVEIKAEERNEHRNFFLEMWSNLGRWTPGWMVTTKADLLFYYFIEDGDLYIISMPALKKWAFKRGSGNKRAGGCMFDFEMRPQSKRVQPNDTWGYCVPIDVIKAQVGCRQYRLTGDRAKVFIPAD